MIEFLGLLLLFFIIFYIIVPLVRFGFKVRRMRNQFRDQMNGFRRAADEKFRNERRSSGFSKPKKKIPGDVGEYVEFEEIEIHEENQTLSDSDNARNFVREEQIVDVTWEDIK